MEIVDVDFDNGEDNDDEDERANVTTIDDSGDDAKVVTIAFRPPKNRR